MPVGNHLFVNKGGDSWAACYWYIRFLGLVDREERYYCKNVLYIQGLHRYKDHLKNIFGPGTCTEQSGIA